MLMDPNLQALFHRQYMQQHTPHPPQQQQQQHARFPFEQMHVQPYAQMMAPPADCKACVVLNRLVEQQEQRYQSMAIHCQKATNELSAVLARLDERVKDVAELSAAKKLLEERVAEQQNAAIAMQTQLAELRAEERRLRALNEELESRNRTLLTEVRAELDGLVAASDQIANNVDRGLLHDKYLANHLLQSADEQEDSAHERGRAATKSAMRAPSEESSSSDTQLVKANTAINRKRLADDIENGGANRDSLHRAKEARVEDAAPKDRSRSRSVAPPSARSAPAEEPAGGERDRSRSRSVTFNDQPRSRSQSQAPAGGRAANAAAAAAGGRAEKTPQQQWEEFRAWGAKLDPELKARQQKSLALWKEREGLVPKVPAGIVLIANPPKIPVPVITVSAEQLEQIKQKRLAAEKRRLSRQQKTT